MIQIQKKEPTKYILNTFIKKRKTLPPLSIICIIYISRAYGFNKIYTLNIAHESGQKR